MVKNPPANAGDKRRGFDPWVSPLEEGMATHSSILAWRLSWTEEPGRLQSIGLQRIGHNWHDLAHMHVRHSELLFFSEGTLILIHYNYSQHSSMIKQTLRLKDQLFLWASLKQRLLHYRWEFTDAVLQQVNSADMYWAPTVCSLWGLSSH